MTPDDGAARSEDRAAVTASTRCDDSVQPDADTPEGKLIQLMVERGALTIGDLFPGAS